ncbi:hypothetical protein MAR_001320, partial [Mya arenaria]
MATGGSSIYKGSDLIHEYSCSKCVENDLNSEAKHFCPLCDHYLCNKCVKLHNGYHNKHTVYGHGDMQKWAGFYMDRCDQHGNKLEVHCDDHQELCCSVCVALTHRDLNSLGNVDSINSMTKRTYSDHVYETQGSTFHSVRIKKDIYKCYIVSICEFPSGEVVIADRRNSRVKLLNNLYQVTDYYDLPYYVQNLCLTAGDNMAVAVDDSLSSHITHEIHFLSVTRGKLQAVRKFTTNHNCRCIAHHQGQLYVSSNCALFQYTMDGTPVKKILEHISRGWPEHRCAVSTDGLRIYETYLSEKKLITLDKDGQ